MQTNVPISTTAYQTALDLAYLASCAIRETVPDKGRIAAMNLHALYTLAERHMMAGIAGMALRRAGVMDDAFREAEGKAVRRTALFDLAREEIFEKLEEAGIWYLPLKGIVLQDLYPAFGMREMSDNDILVDGTRAEDVRRIMEELGFRKEGSTLIHDSFHKEPVLNFEIHYRLFHSAQSKKLDQYYRYAEYRFRKDENGEYRRCMSPEDFYIYVTAHEYRHYEEMGTGLRSLLDTWVILRRLSDVLDRRYIDTELEKLNLSAFEEMNTSLSIHLFDGEDLTEGDKKMLDYILSSGKYGTIQNKVDNGIDRFGGGFLGRSRYFLCRVFLPMDVVRTYYPLFDKIPILLPVLPIYRLYLGITDKKKRKRAQRELKAIRTNHL